MDVDHGRRSGHVSGIINTSIPRGGFIARMT